MTDECGWVVVVWVGRCVADNPSLPPRKVWYCIVLVPRWCMVPRWKIYFPYPISFFACFTKLLKYLCSLFFTFKISFWESTFFQKFWGCYKNANFSCWMFFSPNFVFYNIRYFHYLSCGHKFHVRYFFQKLLILTTFAT
jgi:hypothetical protein